MHRRKVLCLNFSHLDLQYEFHFITSTYLLPGCFHHNHISASGNGARTRTAPAFFLKHSLEVIHITFVHTSLA